MKYSKSFFSSLKDMHGVKNTATRGRRTCLFTVSIFMDRCEGFRFAATAFL
jgi:hypothetical protein